MPCYWRPPAKRRALPKPLRTRLAAGIRIFCCLAIRELVSTNDEVAVSVAMKRTRALPHSRLTIIPSISDYWIFSIKSPLVLGVITWDRDELRPLRICHFCSRDMWRVWNTSLITWHRYKLKNRRFLELYSFLTSIIEHIIRWLS